jgi:hypothetical protein
MTVCLLGLLSRTVYVLTSLFLILSASTMTIDHSLTQNSSPLQTQYSILNYNTMPQHSRTTTCPASTDTRSYFMNSPLLDGIGFKAIGREREQMLLRNQQSSLSGLEFSSGSSPKTFAALTTGAQSNDLEQESTPETNGEASVVVHPSVRKLSYASDKDLFQGLLCPVFEPSTNKRNREYTTPRPMKDICRGSAAPDLPLGGGCIGGEGPHTHSESKNTYSGDVFIIGVSLFKVPDADLRSWLEQEVDVSTQPEADTSQPFSMMSPMPISRSKGGDEEDEAPARSLNPCLVPAFSSSLIQSNRDLLHRRRPQAKHGMRRRQQTSTKSLVMK